MLGISSPEELLDDEAEDALPVEDDDREGADDALLDEDDVPDFALLPPLSASGSEE